MADVNMNENYSFPLEQSIVPDYRCCNSIITWLKSNLEGLTDDDDNTLFSKVNIGYAEENLKSFNKKASCDIHINSVNFIDEFESSKIDTIDTIIVFKLKGNNNNAAETCMIVLDYLLQEFITNNSFRELDGIVKDTRITNAGIRQQPTSSKWYSLGIIELSHQLF